MLDFLMISARNTKRGVVEIYPKFIINKSDDLMIRGGDFYAVWIEEKGLWSTDEHDALELIDLELDTCAKKYKSDDVVVRVLHMWDAESGMIDAWHKYCQRQMRDNYHALDEKLIFSNTKTDKKSYASKKLPYPLEKGSIEAYDQLMSVLYSKEERMKIEWAIGAVVNGDSKTVQKFLVLYGAAGTGKSTILNIIQKLFEGYYAVFSSKALGSSSNAFALEAFKSNPLVAIEHDGDLSRIEDNTRLNSLVSHETMTVNEKFKSTYSNKFNSFLFIGTNKPVKITDAKSGLLRRLIDVSPSGNKIPSPEYKSLIKKIGFELGAIAHYCKEVYETNKSIYDNYIPTNMMGASNDFYNFVSESYTVFKKENNVTLKAAWEMYKEYAEEAKIPYPMPQRSFKEELKNYFYEYKERFTLEDGIRVRNYYLGFRTTIFDNVEEEPAKKLVKNNFIDFKEQSSIFDEDYADYPAQYANKKETPNYKWEKVKTKLKDLDTGKLHYVRLPLEHIVIDFDLKDDNGNKSLELNIEEASKWPTTYAELSKSGQGIHLHYIYSGDSTNLKRLYDDNIEIKVFTGNSSIRRRLTKCNNKPIATISSGLPLKGDGNMIDWDSVKSERMLRNMIKKNLAKEYHANTKPSIDYIYKLLEDAYKKKLTYDISDLRNAVLAFAANSSNQADYCIKLVNKMKFKSEDKIIEIKNEIGADSDIVFYDVEVFPNLFLVNWKKEGVNNSVVRMINPTSTEIVSLMNNKLIGFNCRRYDNHMLYGRMLGYSNERLYKLSQDIIDGKRDAFFGEAYNVSYTDVYDFLSKKQSLKKFEIELGIHHQELGLPWDKPVPEELWNKVAEYCDNDVIATEVVFNDRKADWTARQILADVADMTVNDTTNSLTTRIIFGNDRKPQNQFNYRFMGKIPEDTKTWTFTKDPIFFSEFGDTRYTIFDSKEKPVFPGYSFEGGVSTYRGEEVGEGGYVYAEPGIHTNVALLDIASMHPSSIVAENLFGDEYTQRFNDILRARIAIKHKEFDKAKKMLDGKLAKYLNDEAVAADLAQALKIAINSVYGLTSANFDNPFRDIRNVDNIVAKRGALFMVNLKHEVQARGYTVAHIKTDSIKIPNADEKIIEFVMDYGKQYGYNFEHEATYEKMCLVNDAVYIAKYKDGKHAGKWTATGTQFQVPYVFKTLFSKEPITFDDMCETKSVTSALYLDMNEGLLDDEHNYTFIGKVGRFCPIKPGCNGGLLIRESKDKKTGNIKYDAATGSKGYRWLEAEAVKNLGKQNDIDREYYDTMVEKAIETIAEYGDFDIFVSEPA